MTVRCPICGDRTERFMVYMDLELFQCIRPSCRRCFEVCTSCGHVSTDDGVPMVCSHCWRSRERRPVKLEPLAPGELVNAYGLNLMEECDGTGF